MKLLPDLLVAAGVTLAWATLAYKLPRLWGRLDDSRLRYFSVVIVVIASGLTLEFAQVSDAVDRLAGVPDLSLLLGELLTLAGAWVACALMAHLRHPDRRARQVGRRFGLAAAAPLALLVAFVVLDHRLPDEGDYRLRFGTARAGLFLAFHAVRCAYLSACAGYLARQCWTFARSSLRPSTRLGFGLLVAAGIGAELYVANEVLRMLPTRLGLERLTRPPYALEILVASLALVGFTMPNWGPRAGVDAAAAWIAEYRSLRRLYPLWHALCEAAPDIAMEPPRGRLSDLLDPRDIHFRLYRRVVEIRDGLLLLAPGPDELRALAPTRQEPAADLRAEADALERLSRSIR